MRTLNQLAWIEELLPSEVESKWTTAGLNYYYRDKLILTLTEESKTTELKGRKYPFQLWFGAFFPIEKIKQSAVAAKFSFLENHPGKKNALYLPAETEDFESLIKSVLREIIKGNPLFGEPVNETAAEKRARLNMLESAAEVNMKQPRLFNTGPVTKIKKKKSVIKKTLGLKTKTNKKSENSMILEIAKRRGL